MRKENDTETLARMVANGFSSMDKRFDKIELEIHSLKDEVRLNQRHADRIIMPTLDSHGRRIRDLELRGK